MLNRFLGILVLVLLHGPAIATEGYPTFIAAWVPVEPSPVRSGDAHYLLYEVQFTSYLPMAQTIERIEVLGDKNGAPLVSYVGDELKDNITIPGNRTPERDTINTLEGGASALVYFLVPVPVPDPVPGSLIHRVILSGPDLFNDPTGDPIEGILEFEVAIRPASETIAIDAPLRGGPWQAANGLSNTAGHRRTAMPQDGRPDIAQRYAIDYVMTDEQGNLFEGDEKDNASYFGWGQDVVAVADGVVTSVLEGIPDNPVAGELSLEKTTLDNASGNHVVLDIGDGRFANYAHLQLGSVRVTVGDRVRKGAVLGLLGNSGNSTGPHLHFHVSDRGGSVLASEGLPYVHHQFEWLAQCGFDEELEENECEFGTPQMRYGEMPRNHELVRYP
jgi:hypothetical protein